MPDSDMDKCALLQKAVIANFFTTFENHGGNLGVMLYF